MLYVPSPHFCYPIFVFSNRYQLHTVLISGRYGISKRHQKLTEKVCIRDLCYDTLHRPKSVNFLIATSNLLLNHSYDLIFTLVYYKTE